MCCFRFLHCNLPRERIIPIILVLITLCLEKHVLAAVEITKSTQLVEADASAINITGAGFFGDVGNFSGLISAELIFPDSTTVPCSNSSFISDTLITCKFTQRPKASGPFEAVVKASKEGGGYWSDKKQVGTFVPHIIPSNTTIRYSPQGVEIRLYGFALQSNAHIPLVFNFSSGVWAYVGKENLSEHYVYVFNATEMPACGPLFVSCYTKVRRTDSKLTNVTSNSAQIGIVSPYIESGNSLVSEFVPSIEITGFGLDKAGINFWYNATYTWPATVLEANETHMTLWGELAPGALSVISSCGELDPTPVFTVMPGTYIPTQNLTFIPSLNKRKFTLTIYNFYDDETALYLRENNGNVFSPVLTSINQTTVSFEFAATVPGTLFAWASAFGGNSSEVAIGQSLPAPALRTNIVEPIARNAEFVVINGEQFASLPELVQTHLWLKAGEHDMNCSEMMQLGEGVPLPCTIIEVTNTTITCTANLVLTESFACLWGHVTFDGQETVVPGNITIAKDFIEPPELEELSIILSQSATKLQLQGRRLSSLANFIELFSSPTSDSRIPKSELDCTFSSVSPFSYNLYTLTCSVSGTLPLGDLYAEVLSHGGRSNRVKVANIVPAAEVQSRIDYKRAVNATQLTIIGNNFAVAPLEKSNVVTFLDNSATCEVSEETTATELVCNILGTLKEGVLYATVVTFEGGAIRVGDRRDVGDESQVFAVATIVPPPTIIPNTVSKYSVTPTDTLLTLQGSHFADSPTDNVVHLNIAGSNQPLFCQIVPEQTTTDRIICKVEGLNETEPPAILQASVQCNGGASEVVDFAFFVADANPPSPPSSQNTVAVAVGVPVSVTCAVLVVLLIVFAVHRFKKTRFEAMLSSKVELVQQYSPLNATDVVSAEAILKEWYIKMEELKIGDCVGEGSFGKVYVGRWRGQKVAIKEAILDTPKARQEVFSEARLMCGLRPHNNVVQVLGLAVQGQSNKCYIVMEYLAGSLDKVIYNCEARKRITTEDIRRWARQIAAGMSHVSKENIVHRDLAARNVLLAKDGTVRISDFGMSRALSDGQAAGKTASVVGPIRWMSPDAMKQLYSTKSDVWSYGCLLLELVTGNVPWAMYSDLLEVVTRVRDKGEHPPIPENCDPLLAEIMLKCWNIDPNERPTFDDIVAILGEED